MKHDRIAYLSLDAGEPPEAVVARAERRLRRHVVFGEAPLWLVRELDRFFSTWRVDDAVVDISDLTPFEQAALRAVSQIPPGEMRSYAWVAMQIGRPKAARAVGRVMARNPLPLLFPCHRVVDSSGELHNYFLWPRNESPDSANGGLPRLDANLNEGGAFRPHLLMGVSRGSI